MNRAGSSKKKQWQGVCLYQGVKMQARFLVAGCLCLGLVGLWLGVVLAYGTILEVGVQPDEQLAMVGTLPAFTMPPPFKPPKTGEEWKDDDSQLAETVFQSV